MTFREYEGWEEDLKDVLREVKGWFGTFSASRRLSKALKPHVHDWRWAWLPSSEDPSQYPANGTVQCIAEDCDLGQHMYVKIQRRTDLPKYTGLDPLAR